MESNLKELFDKPKSITTKDLVPNKHVLTRECELVAKLAANTITKQEAAELYIIQSKLIQERVVNG